MLWLGTFDTVEKASDAYNEAGRGFERSYLPHYGNHAHRTQLAGESQDFGAPGHSNPIKECSWTTMKNPGLSSVPLIQQKLAMTLSYPSSQQPTSGTVLSLHTQTIPASALQQHPIFPNDTEIRSGTCEEFELESLCPNVSKTAAEEYIQTFPTTKSLNHPPGSKEQS